MDRQAILDKIAAMLRLQENSTFEGESDAAAAMIDKMCSKYDVTVEDATIPQVLTEDYLTAGRINEAELILFSAVARFYDAKGYVRYDYSSGRRVSTFRCIGTEAQQIQTKLYYEFLLETMKNECEKALKGEQLLAELTGNLFIKTGFRANFHKAFVRKVEERLIEMKATRGDHEHKAVTAVEIAKMNLGTRKTSKAGGLGAAIGSNAGSNASLHRQATGSQSRQLMAAR